MVTVLALINPFSALGNAVAVEQVCFTPGGQCTGVITSEIRTAKSEILVHAYSFTSAPITKALVEAKKRGVNVQVVLDKSQLSERYTGATFLKNAGVPVRIDAAHAITHKKIIIIDGMKVLTGR